MGINYMIILFNWINIIIWVAIIIGVVKGVKEFKKFINRTKRVEKKLDDILDKLEE